MTVSFQTNTLKSRRKAIIDGREYTVRQYGNIERLEVLRLQDEMQEILQKYPPNVLDKDMSKEDVRAIQDKAKQSSETLISLFDDGTEDQFYSRKLVSSLNEDDIVDIITSVFEQTEPKQEKENEKS